MVTRMAARPDPKSEKSQARPYIRSRTLKNTRKNCQCWSTDYMRVTGIPWWKQSRRMREDMPFCNKKLRKSKEVNGTREYWKKIIPWQIGGMEVSLRTVLERRPMVRVVPLERTR